MAQPHPLLAPLMTNYDVVWCPDHLEPYRALWPLGAPTATVYLVEAAAEVVTADSDDGLAGYGVLKALVREAPLCCLVDRSVLRGIYGKTVPS